MRTKSGGALTSSNLRRCSNSPPGRDSGAGGGGDLGEKVCFEAVSVELPFDTTLF